MGYMYTFDELNEFDNVMVYRNNSISIFSGINFPSKNNLEYFTIKKNDEYMCKISIKEPKYIDFYFKDPQPGEFSKTYKLSDIEKIELINILSNNDNEIWKKILEEKNELLEQDDEKYSFDLQIPDYTKLL